MDHAAHIKQEIINFLHVKPRVDAEEEITHRVQFLTDYLLYSHARGFVLGISGGRWAPTRNSGPCACHTGCNLTKRIVRSP